MKHLRTRGIILRRTDYGEADRIMTFLTEDYGRINVIAKGVRKAKSKLAGGIELFSVSELHFIKGRGDIGTLVSARLVSHYGNIVKDLERTNAAYLMLKICDKVLEDTAGQEYFTALQESLAALHHPQISIGLVEVSFSMRLLQLMGHVPDFSKDARGNALNPSEKFTFDYEAGLFVPDQNGGFDKNHIKLLKLLAHNSPAAIVQVQGASQLAEALSPLVRSLRGQHFGI